MTGKRIRNQNKTMTPLPDKCRLVVLVNENREIVATATNIAPDVEIVTTRNAEKFTEEARGMSFTTKADDTVS